MSKAVIVIPARYGSSRLPGKPLLDIVGKPMIQHVYERALQVAGVAEVWVATDDPRVEQAVQAFGGKAIMTRNDHESGTDRLVEVMHKVEADIYINLQGDEPMIRPRDVKRCYKECVTIPRCRWQRYATRFLPQKRLSQAR